MRAVGIDIADTAIHVVEVRQRFGGNALLGYSTTDLPAGAVKNGVVHDTAAVADTLRRCLQDGKPKPLDIDSASFSVPEFTVFTHTFTFPRTLKPKEVEDGIRVQFTEYFPFELEEMVIDWRVTQKSEQTQSVLVCACEKTYIDHIREISEACGIEVQGVDIESMSTARALLPVAKKMEAFLLIDSGASVTSLSIFDESGLQMTSSLNCAGSMLTELIVKKRKLSMKEAEEWKKTIDLVNANFSHVLPLIDSVYGAVHAEANRMMQYFEATTTKKVVAVYLCGGSSQLKGFDVYMHEHIPCTVLLGNPLQHIRHHDILPTNESPFVYTNAIGLTLAALDPKRRAAFNFLKKHVWFGKD